MSSRSKRKASQAQLTVPDSNKIIKSQHNSNIDQSCCFEGDRLAILLNGFRRIIDAERQSNKVVPDKLWYKTHFAVGVNEVTRLLERMNPSSGTSPSTTAPATPLQAVLIASDCNPKWLIKHLPSLASSRSVPLIYVKDRKEGSLRLGELVNVRTAIAIGIKGKGSNINQYVQGLLNHDELNGTGFLDSVTSS